MSVDKCLIELRTDERFAEIDQKELDKIYEEVKARRKRSGMDTKLYDQNLQKYLDDLTMNQAEQEAKLALALQKAQEASELTDRFLEFDPNGATESGLAMNGGSEKPVRGANVSVHGYVHTKEMTLKRIVSVGLDRIEGARVKIKENDLEFDALIVKEMRGSTGGKVTHSVTGDSMAFEIAKVYSRVNKMIHESYLEAGVRMPFYEGYVFRGFHNHTKFVQAGKDGWVKHVMDNNIADWDRIFDGQLFDEADQVEWLEGFWQAVADNDPMEGSGKNIADNGIIRTRPDTLQKSLGAHKSFHFMPGKEIGYSAQFGNGRNLHGNVMAGIRRAASHYGAIKVWGSNPPAGFERWIVQTQRKLGPPTPENSARVKFDESIPKLKANFYTARGYDLKYGQGLFATSGRILRNLNVATKLGSAVVTAITTDPGFSIITRMAQGEGGLIDSTRRAFTDFMESVSKQERVFMAERYGIVVDTEIMRMGDFMQLDSPLVSSNQPGVRGALSRVDEFMQTLAHKSLKWQLFFEQEEIGKYAAAKGTSMSTARWLEQGWQNLEEGTRTLFKRNGIDEEDFVKLRSGVEQVHTQKNQLGITPEKLKEAGLKDLAEKYQLLLIDSAERQINTSNSRQRALISGTSDPDTAIGTIRRLVGQFKSFPLAAMKTLDRSVGGKGRRMSRYSSSDWQNLISFMTLSTTLGYLSLSAKEAMNGRTPPEITGLTLLESMARGGALGLYMDIVATNVHGNRDFTSGIGGPSMGMLNDFARLVKAAGTDIVSDKDQKVATKSMKFIQQHLAVGAGHPLTKFLLQQGITESFDLFNPGETAKEQVRQQKRAQKKGQKQVTLDDIF